jgi:hypothetical protein
MRTDDFIRFENIGFLNFICGVFAIYFIKHDILSLLMMTLHKVKTRLNSKC